MAIYEIPLSPNPQRFVITLAGVTYRVLLVWNIPANVWVIDLLTTGDVPVLRGIPLVANVDLLEPYAYMSLGGSLVATTDNDPDSPPTFNNLGVEGRLYFATP